jgi:hypothetical protein
MKLIAHRFPPSPSLFAYDGLRMTIQATRVSAHDAMLAIRTAGVVIARPVSVVGRRRAPGGRGEECGASRVVKREG